MNTEDRYIDEIVMYINMLYVSMMHFNFSVVVYSNCELEPGTVDAVFYV